MDFEPGRKSKKKASSAVMADGDNIDGYGEEVVVTKEVIVCHTHK
jgi:hypothetical protein